MIKDSTPEITNFESFLEDLKWRIVRREND
jgi:hypothetical protein